MVIFDTNILIEVHRGNLVVKEEIQHLQSTVFYISAITTAEFLVGAKNKEDLKRIERQLSEYTSIPVNAGVTDIFVDLFRSYSLSHRRDIPDAFIAATALYYQLPLYTYNKKHFRFIPGIELI